ncbi:MAG: hypothetical protein HY815_04620 [Candidatus Riflebacteria bacterium]|nr:hypothetical protein [Candidatus Riflebacteria bacterium]
MSSLFSDRRQAIALVIVGIIANASPVVAAAQNLDILSVRSDSSGGSAGAAAAAPVAAPAAAPAAAHAGVEPWGDSDTLSLSGRAVPSSRMFMIAWYASTNRSHPGWTSETMFSTSSFGWVPFEKKEEKDLVTGADGRYRILIERHKKGMFGTRYALVHAKVLFYLRGYAPDEIYITPAQRSRVNLADVARLTLTKRQQGGVVVGPHVRISATLKDGTRSEWTDFGVPSEGAPSNFTLDVGVE